MDNIKTLRVCLSEELPTLENRDPNYFYFLYDKLTLFRGQSLFNDPFAIVESMPSYPAYGLLYMVINDGNVQVYDEYENKTIANIESQDQVELLKQSGTMFFVNSEKRYLDLKRKLITLPYQNGTYELTVSLANDIKIDENTVIGFNPETNQFEIIGDRQDYDLVFTSNYRGKESDSAVINVSENRVSAEVKISKAFDNMIKLTGSGLLADGAGKLKKEDFEIFQDQYHDYKLRIQGYLEELIKAVNDAQYIVSEESISKRILAALESEIPGIEASLAQLDEMASKFDGIEERSMNYTNQQVDFAKGEIINAILDATNNPWTEFDETSINDQKVDDYYPPIVEEEAEESVESDNVIAEEEMESDNSSLDSETEEPIINEDIIGSEEVDTPDNNESGIEDNIIVEDSESEEVVTDELEDVKSDQKEDNIESSEEIVEDEILSDENLSNNTSEENNIEEPISSESDIITEEDESVEEIIPEEKNVIQEDIVEEPQEDTEETTIDESVEDISNNETTTDNEENITNNTEDEETTSV